MTFMTSHFNLLDCILCSRDISAAVLKFRLAFPNEKLKKASFKDMNKMISVARKTEDVLVCPIVKGINQFASTLRHIH